MLCRKLAGKRILPFPIRIKCNGYLTVYLSLSLSIILSLILTLVEGARISTTRMEAECVADIGMNSVLAEFHRELLEQYDLFFVDMSYGSANPRIENSGEHLRSYMKHNFLSEEKKLVGIRDFLGLEVDRAIIPEYAIASDEGGRVMRKQAVTYMEESTVEGALSKIAGQAQEVEGGGLDIRNIDQEESEIQSQIDAIELPKEKDEKGEEKEISLDNPADVVEGLKGSGILEIVLYDVSDLSAAAIYKEEYLSQREKIVGTGLPPEAGSPDGITQKLLFQEYLMEKCGYYGKLQEKSLLKYQTEYILAGEDSDRKNLEKVANKLLDWKKVTNTAYILTDAAKCAEAEALALTLTAVMQVPALVQPVKYSILYAWAYIESLCDVRCILKGGKLPVLKTAKDWKTGIESITNFTGTIPHREENEEGLSYKDYLKIMLFLQADEIQNMRMMDIMEMDIRKTRGNSEFRMDACFDSFLADIEISGGFGTNAQIRKRYGYQ